MFHPKVLINITILTAFTVFGLFVLLIWSAPYTGFMLKPDANSGHMMVVKADNWIINQGLDIGDLIVSVAGPDGKHLNLEPKHVLTSTYQARHHYENRKERLLEFEKVHQIFKQGVVKVELVDGRNITLTLAHPRTFASTSYGVWVRFILSLTAPLLGMLVWIWQPGKKEAQFLLLAGIGLFILTLPSAATIYQIDMFYPSALLFWLLKLAGAIGTFICIGFGACLMMYFPLKLPNAEYLSSRFLFALLIYALVTLFNDWQLGAPLSDQFLYYSYGETYIPMVVSYFTLMILCVLQWKMSNRKPVQRAQVLWVILSWALGPSIFFIFYLIPVVLGEQAFLTRTMTTIAITSCFWMVLLGIARLKLFHIETYIGAAYQWSIVSLLFFGLDIFMIYAVNISPQISTFIILALILWCYLPLRQWVYQSISLNRQHKYQRLFSDAVVQMNHDSMISSVEPNLSWKNLLDTIFSPINIRLDNHLGKTFIDKRGQWLNIQASPYYPAIQLEYADKGTRLFTQDDIALVETLALLFKRLQEFHEAYAAGQTQERERIRRDLHDQIGHKLLSLIYTAKDGKSQRLAKETMTQLRELIQALKDEPILVLDSVIGLKSLSEDACTYAGLSLHWQDFSDHGETQITSNQHLNILNIIRELLNNTIRHAKSNKVSMTVKSQENTLEIILADNGIGFNPDSISPGSGLYNIQSRVEELKAKIGWNTAGGTEVTLEVPLPAEAQEVQDAHD